MLMNVILDAINRNDSFDFKKRTYTVFNKEYTIVFIDGFVKEQTLEYIKRDINSVGEEQLNAINNMEEFAKACINCIDVNTSTNKEMILDAFLEGQVLLFHEPFEECLIMDYRLYPARGISEPDNEKVVRGSHEGFTENLITNTILIRRRLRDFDLEIKTIKLGKYTKTDLAICYVKDKIQQKDLNEIYKVIEKHKNEDLTLGFRSFVKNMLEHTEYNPYPKVRYTERPDLSSLELNSGSIVLILDNSSTALIVPTNFLKLNLVIDDIYMPAMTGVYLKIVSWLILLINLFIPALYLLLTKKPEYFPDYLFNFLPKEEVIIPIVFQILIIELIIDGFKLSSLNTPSSIGNTISIIGGLILGEVALKTKFFVPEILFMMAFVIMTNYAQASNELGYALKLTRIFFVIMTAIFGLYGLIGAILLNFISLVFTKTITKNPYLYPLIPFNLKKLIRLLFIPKKK